MTDILVQIASTPTLRAAFQHVRRNDGCAGADGVSLDEFERDLDINLAALETALRNATYQPLPLLRILVEKHDGSARQLCIPTVRDRVAQAATLDVINPLFEAEFEPCSFGYRRGRSVRDAVHQIKAYYDQGYRWVVEADVDAYFDNVDQQRLLQRVHRLVPDERVVHLIGLWVHAAVWDGSQLYPMSRGIPQGSVISPALANLFLDDLDEALLAANQKLVRYADDFVILCKDRSQAERAVELTHATLQQLALQLDELRITTFDAGFTFLGVTFARSLILQPFEHAQHGKRVLFMPPPLPPGFREGQWRIAT